MISTLYTFGEHSIPLIYKRNPRAKRLSLRISSKERALVLTIPPRGTASQITAFLNHCRPWIEKQLPKVGKTISFQPGAEVSLHGEVFRCMVDPLRRKPALCRETRTLRLPPQHLDKDVYDFFKQMAGNILPPYVLEAAETLGQRVEKITIRDQKSRWGSCSERKTISLNWRLILAPPEVANYVCVHEAAHLLHMNHSLDFWKEVAGMCPLYRIHKKWLKIHGPSLMGV